ncbi:PKD domain-containing protein [archaeon]|nr:PKD domain-containing protein [archaeon]
MNKTIVLGVSLLIVAVMITMPYADAASYGSSFSDWFSKTFLVTKISNKAPTAKITVKAIGYTNSPIVKFYGTSSSDPDGNVVSYKWTFDDGITSYSKTPMHIFKKLGTYTVTLTVKDNEGKSDSTTKTVVVKTLSQALKDTKKKEEPKTQTLAPYTPQDCWCNIHQTASGFYHGRGGHEYTCSCYLVADPSYPNSLVVAEFEWGDGTTGYSNWVQGNNRVYANHTWPVGENSDPITYTLKVWAWTNDSSMRSAYFNGFTATMSQVTKPTQLFGPANGQQETEYDYSCFAGSDPEDHDVRVEWNWGDGTSEKSDWVDSWTQVFASHAWPKGTKKEFTLMVRTEDSDGHYSEWSELEVTMPKTKTKSTTPVISYSVAKPTTSPSLGQAAVIPNQASTVSFSPSRTSGKFPLLVTFKPDSIENIKSYYWEFGDGVKSYSKTPVHIYMKPGTYTARLTATDINGVKTVDTTQITVYLVGA